jgi:anthranilate synthase component 1
MYYPSEQEFLKLSKKGNIVPVYSELLADFDTPLSAFLKIKDGEHSFLLESVEGGEHMGRYSFLGTKPSVIIESRGKEIVKRTEKKTEKFPVKKDPVEELKNIMAAYKVVPLPSLPRFFGGLVGYIGYDMVRFFEKIPDKNPEEYSMPDMQFFMADTLLVFDHVDHKIKVVSNAFIDGDPLYAYQTACSKIDVLIDKLKRPAAVPEMKHVSPVVPEMSSNFTEEEFKKIVEAGKEHIKAGDVIQVVLSQRFKRKTKADGFSIYRALRSINPSPYMYYMELGGGAKIIGSSPEILVRCEDDIAEVRPIAGTRRRGKDIAEDVALEKELLADPKERAEHIMLVDLGRNDIGRVCEYGSVQVDELMCVERYSHVMHIVSDVIGTLREDRDIYDLIRATFPAGTVTGAPKVKAMELIDKFESVKRGPYAGCLGYIGYTGNMDMCITIRTVVMKDDTVYFQAGAGIVLDSDPALEYKETINKSRAMLRALEFAERGLQ